MSIYTIGDLHLSFHESKPMDIFGKNWNNHEKKIKNSWMQTVSENDLVVLLGDFSWSTYLKDTYKDFYYINTLPGKKILLKGNHDYWWTTVTNMRKFLKENNLKNIDFLYNTAYEFENYIISGTRGWGQKEEAEDKKLFNRELIRLEISLKKAKELKQQQTNSKEIIVFLHYPPITNNDIQNGKENEFIEIMKKYEVKKCYYAHLHGDSIKEAIEGEHFGINFKLASADSLNFKLIKIN